MSNLLCFIPQIINTSPNLPTLKNIIRNRANNMGDALEFFVKKAISGDSNEKQIFSWLGSGNKMPDLILRDGDVLEIKKVESIHSFLQLNSSPPKAKLYADDTRIAQGAVRCEDTTWGEKNLYYVVGVCPKGAGIISDLFFVDGECFAADKQIYQNIADKISSAARSAQDVAFNNATNELAGIANIDPLGLTYLRVRGMWNIETPYSLFSDLFKSEAGKFNIALLLVKKNLIFWMNP